MEYESKYDINQVMHARPMANVIGALKHSLAKYGNLEITITDVNSRGFDGKSIISLLVEGNFPIGKQVKITSRGNYSQEILKECVDKIGNVFSGKQKEPFVPEGTFNKY
jgi:phosphotransferase system HPr-like phosphotransfer protein